jgi:3-oxoacyl-[acyl-carrier protein] reductase
MPDAVPEALERPSHTRTVFGRIADRLGTTPQAMLAERARKATLLGRLPTLDEVAETTAFLASPRAGAMTGSVVNLTCGSVTD